MRDAVLRADILQPVRAASAGRDDDRLCKQLKALLAVVEQHALTDVVFEDQVFAGVTEEHLYSIFKQILLDGIVDVLRLFGAEVADRAVDEL